MVEFQGLSTLHILFAVSNEVVLPSESGSDIAMKLYADYVFPRLMDWMMGGETFQMPRADLLKDVYGEVLEIGYGTGLNLPHYPAGVSHLTMIDSARLLSSMVQQRTAQAGFPITV